MISIVEKDGASIITIEAPTPEEKIVLERARIAARRAYENPQPLRKVEAGVVGGIDFSKFKCNRIEPAEKTWFRVIVRNKDGTIYLDEENTAKEDMAYLADYYEQEGYKVIRNISDRPTKPNEEEHIMLRDIADFEELVPADSSYEELFKR